MKPRTLAILILCLLSAAACGSVNTHGVDTHSYTVPIYHQSF